MHHLTRRNGEPLGRRDHTATYFALLRSHESDVLKAPSLEQRQLRVWALRVQALKDILQQEENRLEAHTITGLNDVAVHVKEHVSWLDTEIKKLEKQIDDHIDRHPGLKHDAQLIGSIPGIWSDHGRLT